MNLLQQCIQFTSRSHTQTNHDQQLQARLITLEYSKSIKEVKPYPLHTSDRIFFLCWNFSAKNQLQAAMYPSSDKFSYHCHFENGAKTQRHTHDYIELGYVVKGSFKQRILDKDIIFQEGDFCLIDKNCIHQDYLLSQDSSVIFLGIDNCIFEEIMSENVTTQKIISFLQTALMNQKDLQQFIHFHPMHGAREKMEQCLSLLLSELYEEEIGAAHICKGVLLRIFRLLSTQYEFALTNEQQKTMNWVVFEEICDYIHSHYQNIKTQELIDLFHFQKDYFNRLIKKKTGMTYSAYLQNIRLKKAKELLLTTDMTVTEIAEQVGYHNKGYFYKIFEEKYGTTPSRYKKSLR